MKYLFSERMAPNLRWVSNAEDEAGLLAHDSPIKKGIIFVVSYVDDADAKVDYVKFSNGRDTFTELAKYEPSAGA